LNPTRANDHFHLVDDDPLRRISMKKLLLATIAAATVLVSANANAGPAFPGDERPAASPLLEAASQAMLEDGVFIYCRHYADMTVCKMVTGNMVVLQDRPFSAGGCKAPHKRNSVQLAGQTLHTCVTTVGR
jgi:hypothetical protein